MSRVKYTTEQAILKLREFDVLVSQGKTQLEACKQIQVAKETVARWRREFGGMQVDQAKKLKDLERENDRLKKLVANLSLDNAILKEVSKGNF
jgi:putative transposase